MRLQAEKILDSIRDPTLSPNVGLVTFTTFDLGSRELTIPNGSPAKLPGTSSPNQSSCITIYTSQSLTARPLKNDAWNLDIDDFSFGKVTFQRLRFNLRSIQYHLSLWIRNQKSSWISHKAAASKRSTVDTWKIQKNNAATPPMPLNQEPAPARLCEACWDHGVGLKIYKVPDVKVRLFLWMMSRKWSYWSYFTEKKSENKNTFNGWCWENGSSKKNGETKFTNLFFYKKKNK